jgi:hypothetical protein
MTIFEIISTFFSVLALILSGITAYRTFFAGFKSDVLVKPRVILSRLNKLPCIIIGCEISNKGVKPGSIEDLVLHVKHREQNKFQGISRGLDESGLITPLVTLLGKEA